MHEKKISHCQPYYICIQILHKLQGGKMFTIQPQSLYRLLHQKCFKDGLSFVEETLEQVDTCIKRHIKP